MVKFTRIFAVLAIMFTLLGTHVAKATENGTINVTWGEQTYDQDGVMTQHGFTVSYSDSDGIHSMPNVYLTLTVTPSMEQGPVGADDPSLSGPQNLFDGTVLDDVCTWDQALFVGVNTNGPSLSYETVTYDSVPGHRYYDINVPGFPCPARLCNNALLIGAMTGYAPYNFTIRSSATWDTIYYHTCW